LTVAALISVLTAAVCAGVAATTGRSGFIGLAGCLAIVTTFLSAIGLSILWLRRQGWKLRPLTGPTR
jgi:hypothetical protein